MKIRKSPVLMAILGVLLFPGMVHASVISGKITDINTADQKVTLYREETNESMTVRVHDRSALKNLRRGDFLALEAAKDRSGHWEAASIV